MIKRLLILAIMTSLLISCTWRHHETNKPAPKRPVIIIQKQKVSEFTKVSINGDIDVYLHTNARHYEVILHGDSNDIANTTRMVKDNELVLNVGKGYPKCGRLRVDIYMRHVTSFAYHGSGDVIAKGVTSKCMDLLIDNKKTTLFDGAFSIRRGKFMGSGHTKISGIQSCAMQLSLLENTHVKLIGYSNVATLNMSGSSNLSLYWVKSKSLNIKLKDHACAQLSGISETLNAELWDNSRFNGRYLMSKNSFVKTHDKSIAEISVTKNQHTLANGQSNIYYYFLPEIKTDFMAEDGSVLDMREWERPFLKSPNRYNN